MGVQSMIGNIWDRKRGRRHEVGQDRLEQLERLTQLHLKAEYRYPRKDLVALVNCCREAGLGVRLHLSGFARELPQPVRDAGHEILKEALANVIKHGDGRAAVIIGYEPRRLALRVENPVPEGWREARIGRGGLKHMRRCAGLVGGSLTVGPYTHGWQVSATLPIKPASWRT
jgi:signal transduction histidine kinase